MAWKAKNRHKYLLQYHIIFVCKYRKKLLVSKQISDDIKQFSYEICQRYKVVIKYNGKSVKTLRQRSYSLYDRNKKNKYIGQGQPKFTPVEIVDYEVYEAGSPLALDNG